MRAWMDLTAAEIKTVLEANGVAAGGVYKQKADLAAFAESVLGLDPDNPALFIPDEDTAAQADDGIALATIDPEIPMTVFAAMGEVMRAVSPIAKSEKNLESHYAARGIDDVMDELHGHMAKVGLLVVPEVKSARYEMRGKQQECFLRVRWSFIGPRGDRVRATVAGSALDSSDKATNKALQATLKYLLLDTFLIPVGEPDADTTSPERPTMATAEDLHAIGTWLATIPDEHRDAVTGEVRERFGRSAALTDDQVVPVIDYIKARSEAIKSATFGADHAAADETCPACGGTRLVMVGVGTDAHEEECEWCAPSGLAQDVGACPECGAHPDAPHQDECSRRPL